MEQAGQHRVIHRGDRVGACIGIGCSEDLPLLRDRPREHLKVLQELHHTAQDPVIGTINIIHDQKTGSLLLGHPVGRHVDRALVAMDSWVRIDLERKPVQIAHLLELGGGAVGQLPSSLTGEVHRDLRLPKTVRPPDADRSGTYSGGFLLLEIG